MESALRTKQRTIVFKEGAEHFMNGRWLDLLHTMCKIYVLYVHRSDLTWMADCHLWYQKMDLIQQSNPQEPKHWQQHKDLRTQLFDLLDRLVRAPHEFYMEVLKEWGVNWKGSRTSDRTVQHNLVLLMNQARTRNQSEQMMHMIQMNNESYEDSLHMWSRLRSLMAQIMSPEWLEVHDSSRIDQDSKQNAFDGLVQSFFYLVHSLLHDATRQFGSSNVNLSQQHLWSVLEEDPLAEEYDVMIPPVPIQAFQVLMESFQDNSLNTSAFLVVCLLIAHRVKSIRFMLKSKKKIAGPAQISDPYHYHQYEQSLLTSHSLQSTFGGTTHGRVIKNVLEFKES